jgi:photosystem II stability/assembly factor-like uncharacterized protein
MTWKVSNAPLLNYRCIASSSDGIKMVAGCNQGIYKSTNSGKNWKVSNAPILNYGSITSSSDGKNLVCGELKKHGGIYYSNDYGDSWSQSTSPSTYNGWNCIASSSDGKIVFIGDGDNINNIFISTNYGETWTANVNISGIKCIASSSDGKKIVVGQIGYPYGIYYSNDYGNNWTQSIAPSTYNGWSCIVSSSDGNIVVIGGYNGYIWYSYDSAINWSKSNSPISNWTSIASSLDGNKMVATCDQGIYISIDFGITWNISDAPISDWSSITSSSDGNILVSCQNGSIWYSFTSSIISDICFVKDTLVKTDQGTFPIQTLTKKHTIHKQPILHITKTVHYEPSLVKVCAYAFGTFPTKDTYMSMKHKIYLDGPIQAKNLIHEDTVLLVPYDGEPLYNVLLENHSVMKVHGMLVETMDPTCLVALFYKSKLSPKQKEAMIVTINKDPVSAMSYLKRCQ